MAKLRFPITALFSRDTYSSARKVTRIRYKYLRYFSSKYRYWTILDEKKALSIFKTILDQTDLVIYPIYPSPRKKL